MTSITNRIIQTMIRLGLEHIDPRHVEAWIRYDFDLRHLPEAVFSEYCSRVAGADEAHTIDLEAMAQIEGL